MCVCGVIDLDFCLFWITMILLFLLIIHWFIICVDYSLSSEQLFELNEVEQVLYCETPELELDDVCWLVLRGTARVDSAE